PVLSEQLAEEVAAQLVARDITLQRSAAEAFSDAEGRLLEFMALLTTGTRLQEVIGAQVHERLPEAMAAEREVLRYVSAAHLGGIGVPYDQIQTLVGHTDALPAALDRLREEFLIRLDEQQAWVGLHELRSLAAHSVLHA